jgi:hypothetical protein
VNGWHLVLPAHTRPDTDRVWEYLQQWVTNLALTLRVDADRPDLQVVDVLGKDGTLDHFEMPHLIGPADGRRIQLDAIVLPNGQTNWFRLDLIVPPHGRLWGWHLDWMHPELGVAHEHGEARRGRPVATAASDLDAVSNIAIYALHY